MIIFYSVRNTYMLRRIQQSCFQGRWSCQPSLKIWSSTTAFHYKKLRFSAFPLSKMMKFNISMTAKAASMVVVAFFRHIELGTVRHHSYFNDPIYTLSCQYHYFFSATRLWCQCLRKRSHTICRRQFLSRYRPRSVGQ